MTKSVRISVNDQIQDRTIRHMVFLERYKVSEVRKIRDFLNSSVLPDLRARIEARLEKIIERGSDLGPSTTARLKDLEKEITKLSNDMANTVKAVVTGDVVELTAAEMNWQVKAVKESLGFDLEMVVPAVRSVVKVAKATSFSGLKLDNWFDTLSRSTQRGVMAAVNRGIVEGETTEQIIRRIRGTKALNYTDGVFETTRRQAETIARSTVNHVTNQARVELFKENEDIIKGLKWISTLDSRTSLTCAGLDGKVFPLDKGPRPPAHPNCRSTMTAVLKNADALGLNDIPEGKRAAINGQVPASTTYGEWLKRQPIDVQNEVLGKTRTKLFNEGKLEISKFVGSDLTPLNLNQLRALEQKSFKRAGIEL